MNLIPWRKQQHLPVSRESSLATPVSEFRSELDRLFDRFLGRPGRSWLEPASPSWFEETDRSARDPMFIPSIDVAENDKQITVRMEVPGLAPENIDVNVSGNVLTVRGEKRETSEEKRDDYYHSERRFGSFARSVELPTTADLDGIEARQADGILTVSVKKCPATHARKIDVKTSQRETAGAS